MNRQKIDYGIDLGTTNSAIARMSEGRISIIKDDVRNKDITPSCVQFNRKKVARVGEDAINNRNDETLAVFKRYSETKEINKDANSYIEFKRTMGTTARYISSNMGREYSSEELSAEILKKLKSYVQDDEVSCAVITIPAKFRQVQVEATQRAAELAGFQYCELLQEPIAASMAYGINASKMEGFWVVFDFGGGTFDAALMRVDEGVMKVVDTEGDNHLGGKDLDYAIVDQILVPHLNEQYSLEKIMADENGKQYWREALKQFAERLKIDLSAKPQAECFTDAPLGVDDNGKKIELDITVTKVQFEAKVKPIYQRAIDITKKLLANNKLSGQDLQTVLLVGGPTYSGTLRNMLKEQISPNINITIDPMTSVAIGAALFASTCDIPKNLQKRDRTKIQLKLKYPETTVEAEENLGVMVERKECSGTVPEKVHIEVIRTDKGWSSGRVPLEGDAEIIVIPLLPGEVNGFGISVFDIHGNKLECETSSITIINGLKAARATLPWNVCVDIVEATGDEPKELLDGLQGLGKNQPLPAKGKNTYKTQQDIRPGMKQDQIKIEIYEGEPKTRAILNEFAGEVIITGEDLPQFLPKGSEVVLTISLDESRRISVSTYFPAIDETVDKPLPKLEQKDLSHIVLSRQLKKEKQRVAIMDEEGVYDAQQLQKLEHELDEMTQLLDSGGGDVDTRVTVKERAAEIAIELDKLQDTGKWPAAEEKLNEALESARRINQRFGNEKTKQILSQMEKQCEVILNKKDVKAAKNLTGELSSLEYAIVSQHPGFWINMIKDIDENFSTHEWKDRNRARKLLNQAKEQVITDPEVESLAAITRQIFGEMIRPEAASLRNIDPSKLMKQ